MKKIIVLLIFALVVGFFVGYIIFDFKMNKYIFGYDFFTLTKTYIQLESIVELIENEEYDDVKMKECKSNMHTLARYVQLSPQIGVVSYKLSKIADMCRNDTTVEERQYLKSVYLNLKEYVNMVNNEFNRDDFIKVKLGIYGKMDLNVLEKVFN